MSDQHPKPKKILLACGGTGGHIFPAFSVAEELKNRYPELDILYLCGNRDIENAIFKVIAREKIHSIESAPYRGLRSFVSPSFIGKLTRGFCFSLSILKAEKPDAVIGFGGHYSFPVLMAARFLRIPTMLHEQNVFPGTANKVLMRFSGAVALSFSESQAYLPKHRNLRVTGNPIRAFIEKDSRAAAQTFFGFSPEKLTVLVLGGSQGAESINACYVEALRFLPSDLKAKMQVVHLCGKMEVAAAEEAARVQGVVARAFSFFDRMDLAYGMTDFAIGRAGATFLAEIRAKRIPAILVPYPFAGGHQLLNANAFVKDGDSVVIEQKDLTPEKLAEVLARFVERALNRRRAGRAEEETTRKAGVFEPAARELLADFIEESAGWR